MKYTVKFPGGAEKPIRCDAGELPILGDVIVSDETAYTVIKRVFYSQGGIACEPHIFVALPMCALKKARPK